MRASLVLLVALAVCSNSSGPRQIPVLTTQLSTTTATVGGTVTVSLRASNPTDTALYLSFGMPRVVGEIKVAGVWQRGMLPGPGLDEIDTLSLAPGADASFGSIGLTILPTAIVTTPESFTLTPGRYEVRACYNPLVIAIQGGTVTPASCGNTVTLTVTP